MLQNPCKTLGFKKNMVYKIPPGGEVNHIQPVAYCVTKEQPHIAYQSLYLFIFLSLQWKFLSQISQLLLEPVFSNFVYIFRKAKCTV